MAVAHLVPLPQYADPVLDRLDVNKVVAHRLFRESCYNHKGNYVKVSACRTDPTCSIPLTLARCSF